MISLDAVRMRSLVTHLHDYLINHFHTGPYKHGEQDSVVMATKFLELARKCFFFLFLFPCEVQKKSTEWKSY